MPINVPHNILEMLPAALVFDAVVRHGSFRSAAIELKLSPSTVSARVAALEEALGLRLLHRTTRSVTLTDAGRTLSEEISTILPQWRVAEDRVRAHATEPQGVLVITAPDIFMPSLVIPTAVSFRERFPATSMVFRTTLATLSLLDEGVDVAVRGGPLPASEFGSRQLWSGPHIALATPEWLEAHPISTVQDLMSAPSLALTGRRKLRDWRNDAGETVVHNPYVVMETDTVQSYLSLLGVGAGVGFMAELLALPELRAGTLVRVLPEWVSDEVSFHVVTPSSRRHGAAVRLFVEALVERFESFVLFEPR